MLPVEVVLCYLQGLCDVTCEFVSYYLLRLLPVRL